MEHTLRSNSISINSIIISCDYFDLKWCSPQTVPVSMSRRGMVKWITGTPKKNTDYYFSNNLERGFRSYELSPSETAPAHQRISSPTYYFRHCPTNFLIRLVTCSWPFISASKCTVGYCSRLGRLFGQPTCPVLLPTWKECLGMCSTPKPIFCWV